DQRAEERMAAARRGSELRVELHADEERVPRKLHHLRQLLARRAGRDLVALGLELRHIDVVHLVAVPMALVDLRAVDLVGERALLQRAFLRAQAPGAADVRGLGALLYAPAAVEPFGDDRDRRMRRVGV